MSDEPTPSMRRVRTPCMGICSTTSLGDQVCRGCKRYAWEVIEWNAYGEAEKSAVMDRIEQLTCQIMAEKFRIVSVEQLEQVMHDLSAFYDPALSPYCWLHNLLQKRLHRINSFRELGVELLPAHVHKDPRMLQREVNEELLALSRAHYERYFQQA